MSDNPRNPNVVDFDRDAFDHLYPVAYRAAASVLSPSARPNLAEDVASKAVEEYWRKLQTEETIEDPEALVATIARRRALDARKRWTRKRDLRFREEGDEIEGRANNDYVAVPAKEVSPFGEISSHEIASIIQAAALDGGDEADVEIAVGRMLRGESIEELANRLGLAEKTVRNRETAIKARIRKEVEHRT